MCVYAHKRSSTHIIPHITVTLTRQGSLTRRLLPRDVSVRQNDPLERRRVSRQHSEEVVPSARLHRRCAMGRPTRLDPLVSGKEPLPFVSPFHLPPPGPFPFTVLHFVYPRNRTETV